MANPTTALLVHYGPVYRRKGPFGESLAACRPARIPDNLTLHPIWVTCEKCKQTIAYLYGRQYAD